MQNWESYQFTMPSRLQHSTGQFTFLEWSGTFFSIYLQPSITFLHTLISPNSPFINSPNPSHQNSAKLHLKLRNPNLERNQQSPPPQPPPPPPLAAMYVRPPYKGSVDPEAGGFLARPLYPVMLEPPELRWAFIRKIYSILAIQMVLTVAVASVVVFVRPVSEFFVTSSAGLGLYILLTVTPFIVLCPLFYYYRTHPVNLILLGIFTVAISFALGLSCAFTKGRIILEAAVLTAVVVIGLTLYTFWAARRGQDFNFLGPFLFAGIMLLIVFSFVQLFFPMGRISLMVYGALASLIFCGYIIYDTDNLIKRYGYDEYVWASVALYLDIVNLFLSLLTLFRATDT